LLTHTQTDRQTDRQTDKQTKSGKNITSLAEVIKETIHISYVINDYRCKRLTKNIKAQERLNYRCKNDF